MAEGETQNGTLGELFSEIIQSLRPDDPFPVDCQYEYIEIDPTGVQLTFDHVGQVYLPLHALHTFYKPVKNSLECSLWSYWEPL